MNFETLIELVWKIAEENRQGFTIYLPSCEPVAKGWAIANSETQNSFGIEGLRAVIVYAWDRNRIVGGWFDSRDGQFYFDAVIVEDDQDKAMIMMVLHNQKGIFNLETFDELRNPKFGEGE